MGGGEFRLALAARILVILCIGVDDQGIGRDARGEGDLGFVIREDLASDVPYLRERFGFEGVVGRGEEIPVLVLAFDSKVVQLVALESKARTRTGISSPLPTTPSNPNLSLR